MDWLETSSLASTEASESICSSPMSTASWAAKWDREEWGSMLEEPIILEESAKIPIAASVSPSNSELRCLNSPLRPRILKINTKTPLTIENLAIHDAETATHSTIKRNEAEQEVELQKQQQMLLTPKSKMPQQIPTATPTESKLHVGNAGPMMRSAPTASKLFYGRESKSAFFCRNTVVYVYKSIASAA